MAFASRLFSSTAQQLRPLLWFVALLYGLAISPYSHAGSFPITGNSETEAVKNRVVAAQFLSNASFGPNWAEIQSLAGRMDDIGREAALEEWIEQQFALPASLHQDTALAMIAAEDLDPLQSNLRSRQSYRHFAWWHLAVTAPDQLRQRVAWALSQILVVNERGNGFNNSGADASGQAAFLGVSGYYDLLVSQAFGNYRQLLEDVSYHPIMGNFLSHLNNPPPNPEKDLYPDENYARELLQLFSVGIYQLRKNGQLQTDSDGQPIEIYDNDTIKAFARVFTGLGWGGANRFGCRNSCLNLHEPMSAFDDYHDMEEKILLNGQVLPAGQGIHADIGAALDNVFQHSNVAPFISRLLIQRLVMSNPSKGYIRRVARVFEDNGQGSRGDLKAVVKAILLDREALNRTHFSKVREVLDELPLEQSVDLAAAADTNLTLGGLAASNQLNSQTQVKTKRPKLVALRAENRNTGTEHAQLREPVLRYTAFLRAFSPLSAYPTGFMMIPSQYSDMNQAPYQSPSVFNFYLPDHKAGGAVKDHQVSRKIPNGELYAPEFQILTSVAVNRFANQLRADVIDAKADFNFNSGASGNKSADILLDFATETVLAETPANLMQRLDLLLCGGIMSDGSREIIASAISEETSDAATRAKAAILATLSSPDCAVSQ